MSRRPTEDIAAFNVDVGRLAAKTVEVLLDPDLITDRQYEALFYSIVACMNGAQLAEHLGISQTAANNLRLRGYRNLCRLVPGLGQVDEVNFTLAFAGRPRNDDPERE